MDVTSTDATGAAIAATKDDLILMSNAINEILNGPDSIPDSEFATRVGASRSEAYRLHQQLLAALEDVRAK